MEYYMLSKAIELASKHDSLGKQRIYALITDKRGRIIAHAGNSYVKSHPTQSKLAKDVELDECIYLHAEIACLIKVKQKLPKHSQIYIARVGSNGEPILAAPCPICQHALALAGISRIYHT